ncbi:MAG: FAD-dependent oxidoreductase [Nanoarchaeota archaeon]|nr:FAD-dependent oxidoreductase [Nanoarchaeota archaeon]MBU1644035.1 FAD-dependent oxidoreductase [Nanoarchaeota archaeon]MBU1977277.1 FAD-dependent oxidoreductase [Nanoarchaeota archaeon]
MKRKKKILKKKKAGKVKTVKTARKTGKKRSKLSSLYETIIIGSGIAGCTAAIYAARKKMKFALLTEKLGGQFLESGEVLNYPGIKQTTGADFSKLMEEQLAFNKVKPEVGVVVEKIIKKGKNFVLKTNKKNYWTKTVIITTGARAHELDVPGENRLKQRGVTYCAICDGPLFKGKDVAVIGGGDSALEAVDFLLNIAKKIHIINLTGEFKAHEYLQERIRKHPKIKIINNAKTTEILGERFVSGIRYEQKGKVQELKLSGIFVEIGRAPNTEFVTGFLKLDEHKHIIINSDTSTSVPGIFAAGDCSSVHEYQYVIAAGQGCTALLKTARYLAKNK